VDDIDALLALGGNQRFRAVADAHKRLSRDLERWQAADRQREKRETKWRELQRLVRHAEGLPVARSVEPAAHAIREGRQLLEDPDPLAPLLDQLTDALRGELQRRSNELAIAQRAAVEALEKWEGWPRLAGAVRLSLIEDATLMPAGPADVSTDVRLLEVLDANPLSAWQDRINLVPSRRDQARQRAAKILEPASVAVSPPSATLKNVAELDAYLDDLRARIKPYLDASKTVVI
jgi:hypothetical protein